jgi:cysteinyl-tRNA synthetase
LAGIDLNFPHNDNELAQSEAYHGHQQWVNYFLHAGHLHIKGLKMSKSLKNFITIRQALTEHTPRQLRLMCAWAVLVWVSLFANPSCTCVCILYPSRFLMQPWDRGMNFSDQTVQDAKSKEETFKDFLALAKAYLREDWLAGVIGWPNREIDDALYQAISSAKTAVHAALCDNFDTATVIKTLTTLVADANKALRGTHKPAPLLIRMAAQYITKVCHIAGDRPGTVRIAHYYLRLL